MFQLRAKTTVILLSGQEKFAMPFPRGDLCIILHAGVLADSTSMNVGGVFSSRPWTNVSAVKRDVRIII